MNTTTTKHRAATPVQTYSAAALERLRIDLDMRHAAVQGGFKAYREEVDASIELRSAINRSMPPGAWRGLDPYRCDPAAFLEVDPDELARANIKAEAVQRLIRMKARAVDLLRRNSADHEALQPLARLVARCDEAIRDGLRAAVVPAGTKPAGKPADLAKYQAAIAALTAERAAVVDTGPTHAERRAAVAAWCRDLAERGAQRAVYAIGSGQLSDTFFAHHGARVDGVDVGPMLALAFGPDALADKLSEAIERLPEGITPADRAARLAAIDAEILRVGGLEQDALDALEAADLPAPYRGDADPRIVLRVVAE